MKTGCIYSIEIKTNNKELLPISSDDFEHLYVANIDENGEEIPYSNTQENSLFANFFMVKINKNEDTIDSIFTRLKKRKDITGLIIRFTNGQSQEFDLAKKRVANNGQLENYYEQIIDASDEGLCLLISDQNIKYKKELFI